MKSFVNFFEKLRVRKGPAFLTKRRAFSRAEP